MGVRRHLYVFAMLGDWIEGKDSERGYVLEGVAANFITVIGSSTQRLSRTVRIICRILLHFLEVVLVPHLCWGFLSIIFFILLLVFLLVLLLLPLLLLHWVDLPIRAGVIVTNCLSE
jgi:hypothetical protein